MTSSFPSQRPFLLGCIERKVIARCNPLQIVRTRQSKQQALQNKKAAGKGSRKAMATSDAGRGANVPTLALDNKTIRRPKEATQ